MGSKTSVTELVTNAKLCMLAIFGRNGALFVRDLFAATAAVASNRSVALFWLPSVRSPLRVYPPGSSVEKWQKGCFCRQIHLFLFPFQSPKLNSVSHKQPPKGSEQTEVKNLPNQLSLKTWRRKKKNYLEPSYPPIYGTIVSWCLAEFPEKLWKGGGAEGIFDPKKIVSVFWMAILVTDLEGPVY